jgi:hypothetical protein
MLNTEGGLSHRKSKLQFSLLTLFVVLSVAAVGTWFLAPEVPPDPVVPRSAAEERAIRLFNTSVFFANYRWIPIKIETDSSATSYRITFWTPRRERELVGDRTAIVSLDTGEIEFPGRD